MFKIAQSNAWGFRCFSTNALRPVHRYVCCTVASLSVCWTSVYSKKCSSLSRNKEFLGNGVFANIMISYSYYRNNAYGFIIKVLL